MALAKKQYSSQTFDEVVEEMMMVYMPAEAEISNSWFKESNGEK
jgi:hypothetical protein